MKGKTATYIKQTSLNKFTVFNFTISNKKANVGSLILTVMNKVRGLVFLESFGLNKTPTNQQMNE